MQMMCMRSVQEGMLWQGMVVFVLYVLPPTPLPAPSPLPALPPSNHFQLCFEIVGAIVWWWASSCVLCVRVLCVHTLGQPTLVTKQALLESRHAFDELVSKAEAASPVRRGPTVSTVGTPGPQHRQGGEEHVPMAQLVTFLTPPAASAPHKSKGAAMGPGAKVWPGSRGGRGAGEEEEEEEVDPRVRWVRSSGALTQALSLSSRARALAHARIAGGTSTTFFGHHWQCMQASSACVHMKCCFCCGLPGVAGQVCLQVLGLDR